MLVILSPAKKLAFANKSRDVKKTRPLFPEQTAQLAQICKKLDRHALRRLMKLSEPLSDLNWNRFQAFKPDPNAPDPSQTEAAIYAFRGDTYMGLDADTLTQDDLLVAQDKIRILSGLYGLLRPLDDIQPYRLEMGTRLVTPKGSTLYEYWGQRLAQTLAQDLEDQKNRCLINAASTEYFKAVANHVPDHAPDTRIITPVFQEVSPDHGPRVIGLFAKKARGALARYVIKERLDQPDSLKDFDTDGYKFNPTISDQTTFIFQRSQQSKAFRV